MAPSSLTVPGFLSTSGHRSHLPGGPEARAGKAVHTAKLQSLPHISHVTWWGLSALLLTALWEKAPQTQGKRVPTQHR